MAGGMECTLCNYLISYFRKNEHKNSLSCGLLIINNNNILPWYEEKFCLLKHLKTDILGFAIKV